MYWKMDTENMCSCNNSSDFHYIFLHHRHLHAITGTSSWFKKKKTALFGFYRSLYLGKEVDFTPVSRNKFLCEKTAFKT